MALKETVRKDVETNSGAAKFFVKKAKILTNYPISDNYPI